MKQLIVLLLITFNTFAQQKYWVFFTDKQENAPYAVSENTINNRKLLGLQIHQETDKSVTPAYIQEVANSVDKLEEVSRWMNAVTVQATHEQITQLEKLNFVTNILPVRAYTTASESELKAHRALLQIHLKPMLEQKLNGKNVVIGVIDAGFFKAPENSYVSKIFSENRVLAYRDYVNPAKKDFYGESESWLDGHGTQVLEKIAGYDASANEYRGFSTQSKFYLARTDHGVKENRIEEDYWVAAMEWMDSLGVRLINTSLGYAQGFDNKEENFKIHEMDGKTSVIANAAQLAVQSKGIMIVVSAGNEGNDKSWGIIATPADAKDVLSVGATDMSGFKAGYSSIGPDYLPYVKPEVSCFSMNGTSFSAPVITGLIGCMLQKNPGLSPYQLKNLIVRSCNLYPYANNYVGYGVPVAENLFKLMESNSEGKTNLNNSNKIKVKGSHEIKVSKKETAIVYHKKNSFVVINNDKVKAKKKRIVITPVEGCNFTTVQLSDSVLEIEWITK